MFKIFGRNIRSLLFALIAVVMCGAPTNANEANGLNEARIKNYYEAYAELFNAEKIDIHELDKFLQTRYLDEAVTEIEFLSNASKAPKRYSQDANESKLSILNTAQKMRDMKAQIEFKDIVIDGDNKSAVARYAMHYFGALELTRKNGAAYKIPYRSVSSCVEWLRLPDDVIKIERASCHVTTQYNSK